MQALIMFGWARPSLVLSKKTARDWVVLSILAFFMPKENRHKKELSRNVGTITHAQTHYQVQD